MPDSKLSFLLRWTSPFLPGAARRAVGTRLEPTRSGRLDRRPAGARRLRSAASFDRVLRHERERAFRSGQSFCLVRITPQDDPTAPRVVDAVVDYLVERLRGIDVVGWLDQQSIGIVLPYTLPERGWRIVDDVGQNLPDGLPVPQCEVFRHPASSTDASDRNGNGAPAFGNGAPTNGDGTSTIGNSAENDRNGLGANGDSSNGNGVAGNGESGNGHAPDQDQHETRPADGMDSFFVLPTPRWKRAMDLIGSATGLVFTLPLLAATALAIKLTSPGPVLFRQRRSGAGNAPFVIYKFRTMRIGAEDEMTALRQFSEQDGPAFKMANDPRVTRLGRLLRQTSIDELPQLWNVLKGDMSLVGPRPLPCDESDASEHWHRRRLDVRPGITGSWQVNGRSSIPFADWARMDLRYVASVSLAHDVKILVMTIPAVLSQKGAS